VSHKSICYFMLYAQMFHYYCNTALCLFDYNSLGKHSSTWISMTLAATSSSTTLLFYTISTAILQNFSLHLHMRTTVRLLHPVRLLQRRCCLFETTNWTRPSSGLHALLALQSSPGFEVLPSPRVQAPVKLSQNCRMIVQATFWNSSWLRT
jgi:hypothetical protein